MNPIPEWTDEYNDGAHLGQPREWYMQTEINALRSRLALYEEVNKHLNFANSKLEEVTAEACYKLNGDKTVAVSTDSYWIPINESTPRGVKLQLLGKGGIAAYSTYHHGEFWTHWAALPKRRPDDAQT